MATPAVGRNTRPVFQMSYNAAADLSGHQFKFVRFVGDRSVNLITDSSAQIPCGILQNNPRQGEAALVMHIGRSPGLSRWRCFRRHSDGIVRRWPREAGRCH